MALYRTSCCRTWTWKYEKDTKYNFFFGETLLFRWSTLESPSSLNENWILNENYEWSLTFCHCCKCCWGLWIWFYRDNVVNFVGIWEFNREILLEWASAWRMSVNFVQNWPKLVFPSSPHAFHNLKILYDYSTKQNSSA